MPNGVKLPLACWLVVIETTSTYLAGEKRAVSITSEVVVELSSSDINSNIDFCVSPQRAMSVVLVQVKSVAKLIDFK